MILTHDSKVPIQKVEDILDKIMRRIIGPRAIGLEALGGGKSLFAREDGGWFASG